MKRDAGFTLWFTGLPCSGKSSLADAVASGLKSVRQRVERLDAEAIRGLLWPELGYSKEDRDKNITRVTWLAKTLSRNGVAVVTSFISPYREIRRQARREIGDFIEVYAKCPVEVCITRDTRGMYKKALAGEIKDFTGVSAPYEEPENPEVVVETDKETIRSGVIRVMGKLHEMGYL